MFVESELLQMPLRINGRKAGWLLKATVAGLWAIPLVIVIRAMRPLFFVRFGTINSGRIGHFVADSAEQMARMQESPPRTVELFWLGPVCNQQWKLMLERTLVVGDWVRYLAGWNRVIPGGAIHERPSSYTDSRDFEGLLFRHDVAIPFQPEESETAQNWLRSRGWRVGEPFVCLMVRDPAYLANSESANQGEESTETDWSYHDYRDSDIQDFLPAISWLASQGVWVIRMGRIMEKPLPENMEKVIDYAFDFGRSDFLDVWLFANCDACITTGSGPDELPRLYRRPVLHLNTLPLENSLIWGNTWCPKWLSWADSGQSLSAKEYLKNSWFRKEDYELRGISIRDLSPTELLEEVRNFWARVWGGAFSHEEIGLLEKEFEDLYRQEILGGSNYDWIHPQARLSPRWLQRVFAVSAKD